MAIRLGKNATLKVDLSSAGSGQAVCLGKLDKWSIDQRMDSFEMTAFGDTTASFVTGLPTATFEISGTFDSFDSSFFERMKAGEPIWIGGKPTTDNSTKEQPRMQIYEYAAVYLPENDDGDFVKKDCRILIEPTTKLAEDAEKVRKQALREVQLAGDEDLDFVQVVVRPFGTDYR